MATYSLAPANTSEATRDLQDRLARFARWVFIVSSAILLASISADIAAGAGGRGIWGAFSRVVQLTGGKLMTFVVWSHAAGRAKPVTTLISSTPRSRIRLCFAWSLFGQRVILRPS